MPDLSSHHIQSSVKLLLMGDSGSGKTGSLASLANQGYSLRILDFDNGLDALAHFCTPEARQRVHFQTLTDKMKAVGGKALPDGVPTAFQSGLQLLTNWKVTKKGEVLEDLGRPSEWDDSVVLVIDSLTFAGLAALRYCLALNGRSGEQPWQSDWGDAMRWLEDMLALLYSDAIACHVIVTAHITFDEGRDGVTRGLPTALGTKLPPKVGRYFNTTLLAQTKGRGAAAKRVIRTVSDGLIELKNPAPSRVPAELPLETGLADFFKVVRSLS